MAPAVGDKRTKPTPDKHDEEAMRKRAKRIGGGLFATVDLLPWPSNAKLSACAAQAHVRTKFLHLAPDSMFPTTQEVNTNAMLVIC